MLPKNTHDKYPKNSKNNKSNKNQDGSQEGPRDVLTYGKKRKSIKDFSW